MCKSSVTYLLTISTFSLYLFRSSIYPSPDQGSTTVNIPMSNNTGSLPDLANINFPSPLVTPIDNDLSHGGCSQSSSGISACSSMSGGIALHMQQQCLPMVIGGMQRQMVPAPLILQGASNQLLSGSNNAPSNQVGTTS